jgi:methylmalonyl-CoA/ethylmalonyl-CoA epimerase
MTASLHQVLNLPPCDQIGFVVKDLAAAIALYDPLFGPFTIMNPGPMTFNYRGREEESEIKLAFGKSGEVEIELIEWVSGCTPHKEFLDAGREGMQHLRFIVENLEEKVAEAEQLDYRSIWSKRFGEGQAVAYLERQDDPLIIEFFENHPG